MPIYDSTLIPSGFDWADGLDGRPGTPTPDGAIALQSANGETNPLIDDQVVYEEFPDSPEIERAEQATVVHQFKMDYFTGQIYLSALGRGVYLSDSAGNITKILSSTLKRARGNQSVLKIIAEGISFDTPPDEFRLDVIELNPALEKHPRYAFLPTDIRRLVNMDVQAAQIASEQETKNLLSTISNRTTAPSATWTGSAAAYWQIVQNAATELLLKRRIGEDTFYLPGYRVTWAQYFWMPQFLNAGGYIEDPIAQGGLPAYFWSTDQTPDGLSIFDNLPDLNPQFYDQGISWLRQSDVVEYSRTWFRYVHTWIGAPYAHWDAEVYSQDPSPYPPPPLIPLS